MSSSSTSYYTYLIFWSSSITWSNLFLFYFYFIFIRFSSDIYFLDFIPLSYSSILRVYASPIIYFNSSFIPWIRLVKLATCLFLIWLFYWSRASLFSFIKQSSSSSSSSLSSLIYLRLLSLIFSIAINSCRAYRNYLSNFQ